MREIMVVAGEASGDMHAAEVVKEMKSLAPQMDYFGLGGQRLYEQGVEIIFDPTQLSTIGFIEAAKHFKRMYDVLAKLEAEMKRRQPEVVFLVDYSYFNRKVAKRAAKLGIPTVDYFAPSAWVWGRWRAKKMADYGVKIASVFPMEEQVYREAGADVEFVGHPLVDMVEPELSPAELADKYNLSLADKPVVGILPGSRQQEIDALLPKMLEAAEQIQKEYPEVEFLLPVAETVSQMDIEEEVSNYNLNITLLTGYSYAVMSAADIILSASGTATLEAACLETPMVIAYQTSWSTYLLGKLLVNLPYVGLPNIILEEEVVPELLQGEVTADNLAWEAVQLLEDADKYQATEQKLARVREELGADGAVKRVAELVLTTGGIEHGTG